jgi:hypothetical protein
MNDIDRLVLTIQMSHMSELCYWGTVNMNKPVEVEGILYSREDIWNKLDGIADELSAGGLDTEETEYLVQRALFLLDMVKQYYIGGNTND